MSTVNYFQNAYTEVMEITKVFSANLERIRGESGMSARQLGQMAGVTAKHIYDIEKGIRKPSLDLLEKLSSSLNIPVGVLLAHEFEPKAYIKSEPVSVLAKRLLLIPDRVYELAQKLGPNDEAWTEIVIPFLEETIKERKKEKKENMA